MVMEESVPASWPACGTPWLELMMSCAIFELEATGSVAEATGAILEISAVTFALSDATYGVLWLNSLAATTCSGAGSVGWRSIGCGVCSAFSTSVVSRLNWAGFFGASGAGRCLVGSGTSVFSAFGSISTCLTVNGPRRSLCCAGVCIRGIL